MMENKEPASAPANGGTQGYDYSTHNSALPADYADFLSWKAEQEIAAAKKATDEKAAKLEADRAERDQRIAGAVYATQAQRQKRAFKRAAAAAAAAALTAAIPIFLAVLAGDSLEDK